MSIAFATNLMNFGGGCLGMTDYWQLRAACRGADPRIFDTRANLVEARKFCGQCPVLAQCRGAGDGAQSGIFAGEWVTNPQAVTSLNRFFEAHGTEHGYRRHLERGERPCDACEQAAYRRVNERSRVRRERVSA